MVCKTRGRGHPGKLEKGAGFYFPAGAATSGGAAFLAALVASRWAFNSLAFSIIFIFTFFSRASSLASR